jgi:hypothetical protein
VVLATTDGASRHRAYQDHDERAQFSPFVNQMTHDPTAKARQPPTINGRPPGSPAGADKGA